MTVRRERVVADRSPIDSSEVGEVLPLWSPSSIRNRHVSRCAGAAETKTWRVAGSCGGGGV